MPTSPPSAGRHQRFEFFFALGLFTLVTIVSMLGQSTLSFNDGAGWDGVYYRQTAQQISTGISPLGTAPFVYRLGTPYLVGTFFGDNLLFGFKVVNLAGSLLAALLLVLWLRLYLHGWRIRVMLSTLFLITWHGPVRFVHYYPAYVDPWFIAALLAGLIGIRKVQDHPTLARVGLLSLIVSAGVLFREAVLLIPLAFLFSTNPLDVAGGRIRLPAGNSPAHRFGKILLLLVPLGIGFLTLRLVFAAAGQTNAYSFPDAAWDLAYRKPFLTYLHAWFITFGPILVLVLYNVRASLHFLAKNQFMLIYLTGFAVLAWIGGGDTERVLFWAMPVIYLLIGKAMQDHRELLASLPLQMVLVVAQLLAARAFWTIPGYPNDHATPFPVLTIPANDFSYLDLYSFHGDRVIQATALVEYVLLTVVVLQWLSYRSRKLRAARVGQASPNVVG